MNSTLDVSRQHEATLHCNAPNPPKHIPDKKLDGAASKLSCSVPMTIVYWSCPNHQPYERDKIRLPFLSATHSGRCRLCRHADRLSGLQSKNDRSRHSACADGRAPGTDSSSGSNFCGGNSLRSATSLECPGSRCMSIVRWRAASWRCSLHRLRLQPGNTSTDRCRQTRCPWPSHCGRARSSLV
jgi:hypothetical protein